jgi:hypothetical protein
MKLRNIPIQEVYETILELKEKIKRNQVLQTGHHKEKWKEVINSYSWVLTLLETTNQVEPPEGTNNEPIR